MKRLLILLIGIICFTISSLAQPGTPTEVVDGNLKVLGKMIFYFRK